VIPDRHNSAIAIKELAYVLFFSMIQPYQVRSLFVDYMYIIRRSFVYYTNDLRINYE